MSLRDEVERHLPNWETWYSSLFEAANDLGVIRARVCSPSSLLLSNRHSSVQRAAEDAHREKWGGQAEEWLPSRIADRQPPKKKKKRKRARKRRSD